MAYIYTTLLDAIAIAGAGAICDKLTRVDDLVVSTNRQDECFSLQDSTYADLRFYIKTSRLNDITVAGFKSWLAENPMTVYYPLATPTDEEITDATLLAQLEALEGAYTYEDITNIFIAASGDNLVVELAAKVRKA